MKQGSIKVAKTMKVDFELTNLENNSIPNRMHDIYADTIDAFQFIGVPLK